MKNTTLVPSKSKIRGKNHKEEYHPLLNRQDARRSQKYGCGEQKMQITNRLKTTSSRRIINETADHDHNFAPTEHQLINVP